MANDFTLLAVPEFRVKEYAGGAPLPHVATAAPCVIPGWLSAPVADQSDEFVDGRDVDVGDFLLNPVLLWFHEQKTPPLGKVNALSVYPYGTGEYTGLYGQFEFDPTDEFAQRVYRKYEQGYMRGFSIGYRAIGTRSMTGDELKAIGYGGSKRITRLKVKLLEASAVPVPDNQRALADLKKSLNLTDPQAAILDRLAPPATSFAADFTAVFANRFPAKPEESVKAGAAPMDAKAMATTSDTSGGSTVATPDANKDGEKKPDEMKPGAEAANTFLKGHLAHAKKHAEMFAGVEHPPAVKAHKKCMGYLHKACKAMHEMATKEYPDHADEWKEHGTLMADVFKPDGSGGDAEKESDEQEREERAAEKAFRDALVADLDTEFTEVKTSVGEIKAWQAKAEEFFGELAESQKTVSEKVDGLYAVRR